MSWRWSRAWRTFGPSVCPTWSPLPVRAHTSWPRAARGWSMDLWDARRASICWWVASGWADFIFCKVRLQLTTHKTVCETHHTKTHHSVQTQHRHTRWLALFCHTHVFHNFTSSSFSPTMPQGSAVSHGNPIMTSPLPSPGRWRCIFGFSAPASCQLCVFVFFFVARCQPAPLIPPNLVQGWVHSGKLCLFSTSCRYRKWLFSLFFSLRDVERLTEMVTGGFCVFRFQ